MNRRVSASDRLTIVVLGYIVRGPLGGLVWHHLQYVMGLANLGHDVYFVEDSGESLWCCYDADRHVSDTDPSYGLRFADAAFRMAGVPDRWAYYDAHRDRWHGPAGDRLLAICERADLLIDVSGVNTMRPWFRQIPNRALIDTDPAFTQLRHLSEPAARAEAACHTSFFSFAENIGGDARLPADGFPWVPTRQPVVLDAWRVSPGPSDGPFTTVMQWDSYPPREHEGQLYGMKSDSFAPFLELPAAAGPRFEVAVGGDKAHGILSPHGWRVRNPLTLIRDAAAYQEYIRQSKAEFTVAKHGYVVARSGWFSERSAAYLASGRPVLAQDTGFSAWLPTGAGLHAFTTVEEVQTAIGIVDAHYENECRVARAIATEFFDANRVLPSLVERAMSMSASATASA